MPYLGPTEILPPPPFTIKDVRDAVPAHLFERSTLKSSLYLVMDVVIVAGLFWLASFIPSFSTEGQFLLWPIYWFVQGAVMTGIWVIAHECGHQAFSDSKFINNAVGLVFHSLLLVPYHSWRITHGMHHKGTAHMEKDQVFVPAKKSTVLQRFGVHDISELIEVSPLASLIGIFIMSFLGWPGYLLFNIASQDYKQRANHFEPDSPMFKKSQHGDVLLSDIGLIVVGAGLYYLSWTFGFMTVFQYYGAPYLWVNFWLVLITYLQHTHKNVPHYRGDEWTFLRGAISTVDRDYGILNYVFHHITDSHVAHHLFSTMPHYNAVEATKHIKKVLGKYYIQDTTPIGKALWDSWTTCHYVEDDGDVLLYKTIGKKSQ